MRRRTARGSLTGRAAHTLIELLVATAVLTLLGTLLLRMVDGATGLWRDAAADADRLREARAALDLIARDLQTAYGCVAGHGLPGLVLEGVGTPRAEGATGAGSTEAAALFFLGLAPGSARQPERAGDLCAFGYYLAFTADGGDRGFAAGGSRKLYRRLVDGPTTLARCQAVLAGTLTWDDLFWPTRADDGGSRPDPVLARNVAAFAALPLVAAADGNLVPAGAWAGDQWPAAVELRLTALAADAAAKLPDEAAWDDANLPIIRQRSRTFRVRVAPAAPAAAAAAVARPSPPASPASP